MWNLGKMVQMNFFVKQKERHRCRELRDIKGKGGGWNELGVGIDI